MNISRSSFYYWQKHLSIPSSRTIKFLNNILLFEKYHEKYPSHGYRWLNAKIRLDTKTILSNVTAHKYCKPLGIKSRSKHYKYQKSGQPYRTYPTLLLSELDIKGSYQNQGTVNSFTQIFSDILAKVQLYKFNGQCTSPVNINQLLLQIPLLIKLTVFKIFLLRNTVLRQAYLLDASCSSNVFCPNHCWLYNVILHIQASMLIHHQEKYVVVKHFCNTNG